MLKSCTVPPILTEVLLIWPRGEPRRAWPSWYWLSILQMTQKSRIMGRFVDCRFLKYVSNWVSVQKLPRWNPALIISLSLQCGQEKLQPTSIRHQPLFTATRAKQLQHPWLWLFWALNINQSLREKMHWAKFLYLWIQTNRWIEWHHSLKEWSIRNFKNYQLTLLTYVIKNALFCVIRG